MNLSMGNKNVVLGLIVIMLYLLMTFFIERTSALHGFHSKAAAVVVDTKGSANLLDHQIVDVKKGPAYRTGGIYFTNYYPASYIPVPNNYKDTAYNMRFYAWMAALFGIAVGVIVGLQTQASMALRSWASWLAVIGVVLFPVRDTVGFWGRWFNPNYGFGPLGPIVYPIKWLGGTAIFFALLLALIVFVQGAQRAAAK
jgi:hypothetical protein